MLGIFARSFRVATRSDRWHPPQGNRTRIDRTRRQPHA